VKDINDTKYHAIRLFSQIENFSQNLNRTQNDFLGKYSNLISDIILKTRKRRKKLFWRHLNIIYVFFLNKLQITLSYIVFHMSSLNFEHIPLLKEMRLNTIYTKFAILNTIYDNNSTANIQCYWSLYGTKSVPHFVPIKCLLIL
jgi:hypothetical protein